MFSSESSGQVNQSQLVFQEQPKTLRKWVKVTLVALTALMILASALGIGGGVVGIVGLQVSAAPGFLVFFGTKLTMGGAIGAIFGGATLIPFSALLITLVCAYRKQHNKVEIGLREPETSSKTPRRFLLAEERRGS